MGSGHHQGLKDVMSNPTKTTPPREGVTSQEESLVMEEVQAMLKKGEVVEIPKQERGKGFYSSIFLVLKKGRGMKPVIILKALNEFIPFAHFKIEGMQP